ncbi:CBS domain-containing protein [Xylanibacillus composti]|uniref:CBS domain-containing protein n=1 Tax=Xylanibacillus composti TaxID=1572762 RepID=A0A8J4H0K2_9BACL|nr:CBS domain-containing protein [Xylanibacillus composti]MDT9724153.1 CBS domain-containing protein [Xylanibacillus composti]GIQ68702.1 CBS domain-containing protein [Xylanibacillus composti]
MEKKLRDIMSRDCVTITLQDNVYEIAVKMKEHDIGFIPVVENKKLIGVVTDRDLVVRGYAEKRSGSFEVREVMSTDVVTASPEMTVDEAANLMARNQIRRLPVVENGELVGIVAIGDLAVREIFVNEAGEALSEISEEREPATV